MHILTLSLRCESLLRGVSATLHRSSSASETRHSSRLFAAQKEVDAWFEFYDSNKDGKVHYDEYMALPKSNQQYWDNVDINKDQ